MTDLHVIKALIGSALSHSSRPTHASRRVLAHDFDLELVLAGSHKLCGAGWGGDAKLPPTLNPLKYFPSCRSKWASDASGWRRLGIVARSKRCAMASMIDSSTLKAREHARKGHLKNKRGRKTRKQTQTHGARAQSKPRGKGLQLAISCPAEEKSFKVL